MITEVKHINLSQTRYIFHGIVFVFKNNVSLFLFIYFSNNLFHLDFILIWDFQN